MSVAGWTMFVLFFLWSFLGMPIGYAMLASGIVYLMMTHQDLALVATQSLNGLYGSFVLLSVPLFILAAEIMNAGQLTEKMYGVANMLVGRYKGGLAHVNIVASVIFSGMSGSAMADAAGPGKLEVDAMVKTGYAPGFAAALSSTSAIIGPIIPPSIPMVLYGAVADTSIGYLFMGGVIPGLMLAAAQSGVVAVMARYKDFPVAPVLTLGQSMREVGHAIPVLCLPAILLGGIYSGAVTPTEAAAVAAFCALLLAVFWYRTLNYSAFYQVLINSSKATTIVAITIAGALVMNWIVAAEQIPKMLGLWIIELDLTPALFMFAVTVLFLVLGAFLDTLLMLLIIIPILMPTVISLGIDPVHFGVVSVVNLMIGLVTPPMGALVFLIAGVSGIRVVDITKELWPFLIVLIALLFVLVYVPQLTLWLPETMGYQVQGDFYALSALGTTAMPGMKDLVKGTDRYRNYIGGSWVESNLKEWIEVENPATGQVIASVPRGNADDADRAVTAAYQAQPAWEAMPPASRGQLLKDLSRALLENRERLARIVIAEQGKPLQEARGEIEGAALYLSYAAEEARRITGDIIPSDNPDEQIWIQRVAHGVVIALTAWNYPAGLMCRKVGPALIAGNTIVVKSHEGTPTTALEIAQLADQVGFPAGVINVISGTGEGVGRALVQHPQSRLITLTGSVRAGKDIFRNAADDLKLLRLELGGKAPFIVAEDADIGAAVRAAVLSRFENCGQVCICNERMYVHEKIADEFLERFISAVKQLKVGDPMTLVDVGPKFSGPELDKVDGMVEAAKAAGAEVLTGGRRLTDGEFSRGHWYEPTILKVGDNAMAIMQDEVFGPVVPVMTVTDFDEGLRLANESRYGLSAYVFTKDMRRMMRLIRELKFGEIYVNKAGGDVVQAHHAGIKDSGIGGEDGKYGLDAYFQKKTIYVNYA